MSKNKDIIYKRMSEESLLYQKYKGLALDVFRWNGLEDLDGDLTSLDIEQVLYEKGEGCFLYDEGLKEYVFLPSYDTATRNIYGRSDTKYLTSYNGMINKSVNLKEDKVINVWNNDLRQPTMGYIREYASKMQEVELAIKQNIFMQKFPYMVACSKKNEMSMRTLFNKIALGEPAIFTSEKLNIESIKILPAQAPYVVDRLNQYRYELEREILTYLGINNSYEKQERLIVDEVNSNNDFIQRNIEVQFKQRQIACERINKMFDLNLSVEIVSDTVKEKEYKLEKMEQDILSEGQDLDNMKDPMSEQDPKKKDITMDQSILNALAKTITNYKEEEI